MDAQDGREAALDVSNIDPSSSATGLGASNVLLNTDNTFWSPSAVDTSPHVAVKLNDLSIVTGLLVKGTLPSGFTVEYKRTDDDAYTSLKADNKTVVGCLKGFILYNQ